jgi:hypothetical protein
MSTWVKSRRGILEHLQQQRLCITDFAVLQLLLLLADKKNGVAWTKANALADFFQDRNWRTVKDSLHRLKEKRYIKSFQQLGSRGNYPILVNKYEITVGDLKNRRVVAEHTVDWRQPETEPCPDNRPEDRPP